MLQLRTSIYQKNTSRKLKSASRNMQWRGHWKSRKRAPEAAFWRVLCLTFWKMRPRTWSCSRKSTCFSERLLFPNHVKQTIIFIFKQSNILLLNKVLSIIAYIYIYIMYHPLDLDFLVISQPEVHSIFPHSILVAICGPNACIDKSIWPSQPVCSWTVKRNSRSDR